MSKNKQTVEILAPAGSFEIMTAVIKAGADAVYLGGDLFGARAFANNFNQEELIRAIEYAHLHDRKIYLTVNTLLKEKEIRNRLIAYLTPFYEAGLDAVIVQDFGVLKMIREEFPDLAVHASTQMAITGHYGAQMLKDAGATRIVTARELNVEEIRSIHQNCEIEIESFVHGALCYCYSGQCLFSSMNGGRSGNRGRCAQPCRMNYDVSEEKNQVLNKKEEQYVLSPKDMCALDILPDVIDAGVFSLKIEGRMKNITYAAGVTSMYRKYVDLYLEKGKKGYQVSKDDIKTLMDLYNRGAFTSGYYQKAKGREMISLSRPNHMGVKALTVEANKNGLITFKALEKIHPQDVFEVDRENSFTSGGEYQPGQTFQVNLPRKYQLKKGDLIYRTRNNEIVMDVKEAYVAPRLKKMVRARVIAKVGQPLSMELTDGAVRVTVIGNTVEKAMKQPMTEEKLKSQFSKLGDTDFEMKQIEVESIGDIFIPVGQINELRRNAVEELTRAILDQYKRNVGQHAGIKEIFEEDMTNEAAFAERQDSALEGQENQWNECSQCKRRSILVCNLRQAEYVADLESVDMLYLEYGILSNVMRKQDEYDDTIRFVMEKLHKKGKKVALALPHMLRDKNDARFASLLEKATKMHFDAYLVRNMEELGAIAALAAKSEDEYHIITDAGMYVWNSMAKEELKKLTESHGLHLMSVTLPLEQTSRELSDTIQLQSDHANCIQKELIVYTRLPLMLSEQCVRKTFGKCNHNNDRITITDRKHKDYTVKSYCEYCYTVVYDNKCMNISDMQQQIDLTGADSIRYEFVDEFEMEDKIKNVLYGKFEESDITRGHFELGVE